MRADYHVHTEFSDDSDYAMEKVIQDSISQETLVQWDYLKLQ